MRAVWTVVSVVLLINTLLLGAAVGWLVHTGRLDQARIYRVRDMLSLTIAQEEQQEWVAKQLEEQSRQKVMEIARLESVNDGPITLADRLIAEQRGDELAEQRIARLRRDILDMRNQLRLAKEQLIKKEAGLSAQRTAFEQAVAKQVRLNVDADFRKALQMIQQVKPDQAKQIFQQLVRIGKKSQVVDYLAAMQPRKAAAVMKSFKTPQEIVQATDLLQALQDRGIGLAVGGLDGPRQPKQSLNDDQSGGSS